MNRTLLLLSAALLAGGILVFWMYQQQFRVEHGGGPTVEVVSALVDIELGQPVRAEWLGTKEIPQSYLEERHIPVVVHRRDEATLIHMETGLNAGFLDIAPSVRVEERDLQDVVPFQDLTRNTQVFGHEPTGRNTPSLSVTTVTHLDRRLVDMPPAHGDGAGESGDTAATLRLCRPPEPLALWPQPRACA